MSTASKNLKRAHRRKHQIASQFRELTDGDITIESVLRTPPSALRRIRIFDVLRRAPHLGDVGADKVLVKAKCWPTQRLAQVPPEEIDRVINHLPERARNR